MSKAREVLSKLGAVQEAKVDAVEVFDVRETEEACKFFKKWYKKGYKVFNFDAGSDDHILVASKAKPSPKDVAAAAPPGQLKKGLKFDSEVDFDTFCED